MLSINDKCLANSCHVVHISVKEVQHQFEILKAKCLASWVVHKIATEKKKLSTHLSKCSRCNARQSVIMSF